MDPYLEGYLWHSVHAFMASTIVRQLAPQLRPKYLVLPVEQLTIVSNDDDLNERVVLPDLSLIATRTRPRLSHSETLVAPMELLTVMSEEVPSYNVEIRDVLRRKLVTSIEILSPSNKVGKGREQYLEKRNDLFHSSAHLLEIDLLRSGKRVPMRKPLPVSAYFVLLSRAHRRPMLEVWPISLRDKLPTVAVPLMFSDADATLDLQAAICDVYDQMNLDTGIDYSQPPDPPLTAADEIWADKLLKPYRKRTRKK